MTLESHLVALGMSAVDAAVVVQDLRFHHKRKTLEELSELFDGIAQVYGCIRDDVFSCVRSFPPLAGYDHVRVVREKERLGRLFGISVESIIDALLKKPRLAGCARRRDLAVVDIGRTLAREYDVDAQTLFDAYFVYFTKSPYVPGSRRQRISHVPGYEAPPMMKKMRAYVEKRCERRHAA